MPSMIIDDHKAAEYILERQAVSNISYGLLSICAYVKRYAKKEIELKMLDLNYEVFKAYQKETDAKGPVFKVLNHAIESFKPDIVGISIMFNISYMYLEQAAECVKKYDPNTLVIVGGNLATSLYEEIMQSENIDCVAYGEGEIPFCQLIDSDDIREHLVKNPAFVTKDKLKAGIKPVNVLVEDLDSLPAVDFDLSDVKGYKLPTTRFFQREHGTNELPTALVIYTTRGCPFNCCFCACHIVHGKKVRFMSVEKVLKDVRLMIKKHDLKILMINDDNFLIDKARAKKILAELARLELIVAFPSLLLRNIDKETAFLLSKVGVTNQLVSIESGSEYVLKHIIDKPLTKEQIFSSVENLKNAGISVDTNVIIGFPGETDEHRQETLKTIYDVGFNWVHFIIALPVPGTRLYGQCKENNYLVNDDNFYSPDLSRCNIKTPEYEPEHIQHQAYMMNLHANFINNYNLRIGNYDECIKHFNSIIKTVPNHAFAYYGLMKAYEGKGEAEKAKANKSKFLKIINHEPFWKDYADYFNIINEGCCSAQNG